MPVHNNVAITAIFPQFHGILKINNVITHYRRGKASLAQQ
jgi:hypothetical protein